MPIPIPTLPADFPTGYSLSRRKAYADHCTKRCAGGKPCASTTKHVHQWHLCNDAECECRGELRRGK